MRTVQQVPRVYRVYYGYSRRALSLCPSANTTPSLCPRCALYLCLCPSLPLTLPRAASELISWRCAGTGTPPARQAPGHGTSVNDGLAPRVLPDPLFLRPPVQQPTNTCDAYTSLPRPVHDSPCCLATLTLALAFACPGPSDCIAAFSWGRWTRDRPRSSEAATCLVPTELLHAG